MFSPLTEGSAQTAYGAGCHSMLCSECLFLFLIYLLSSRPVFQTPILQTLDKDAINFDDELAVHSRLLPLNTSGSGDCLLNALLYGPSIDAIFYYSTNDRLRWRLVVNAFSFSPSSQRSARPSTQKAGTLSPLPDKAVRMCDVNDSF